VCVAGKARYKIVFLKGRNAWVAKPILEVKDYTHLTHIKRYIILTNTRTTGHAELQQARQYTKEHCRPPKEEVIAKHLSRFPTQTLNQRFHSN